MTTSANARRMLADAKNLEARAKIARGHDAEDLRRRARNLRDAAARIEAAERAKRGDELPLE